jgi:hypothetical protein
MGSIFSHRVPVPFEKNYKKYQPYIREDFHECCAYCLIHERFARGEENFELDHHRPQSKFPKLHNEYTNIYYSCHPCNNSKWQHWPSRELESKGYRFIDTCKDTFSDHFVDEHGYWRPISKVGEYTADKVRLNSKHNIEIRKMLSNLFNKLDAETIDWNKPLKEQIIPLLDQIYE